MTKITLQWCTNDKFARIFGHLKQLRAKQMSYHYNFFEILNGEDRDSALFFSLI